jgi:hypothetical protein
MPKLLQIPLFSGFLLVLALQMPCHALFGLEKIKPELSLLKVQTEALAKVDATLFDKAGQNADALIKMNGRIGDIEAKLNIQGAAVAGFKNQVSNLSSGRDTIQNTSGASDTLIKFIFGKWYLFLGAFMTFFGTLVAQYERLLKAKDAQIKRLMDSEEAKDIKSDDWFRKYLESVTGHKTNGLTAGQQDAKDILDETIKEGEVKTNGLKQD